MTSAPPATSDSLFASARRAPDSSAARVGSKPERADEGVEHDVRIHDSYQFGHRVGTAQQAVPSKRRRGIRIGDGDVCTHRWPNLLREQVEVAAAGGEADHLEPVGVGGDHLERLGTDRTGAAEQEDADGLFSARAIVRR